MEPHGASFRDGNRAAEVCDGIALSAKSGQRAEVRYRELQTATTTPHQRPSSRLQET